MPSVARSRGWLPRPTRVVGALVTATVVASAIVLSVHPNASPQAGVALAANSPKAYVGLFKEDAVAVLDTATNTVLSKITVPAGPHGLAVTPDGGKLYVSSDGATTVSVVDTSTDRIVHTIEVGKAPHGVTITPDGRTALVGVWGDGQVAFVDTATDAVVRQSAVGSPHNIAFTPEGAFAYVGSQAQDAPALVKLNVATGEAVARLSLDGAPRGLSVTPDGASVYVTRAGQDDVLVVDSGSNQAGTRINVGPSPHLPSFTSNGLGLVNVQGSGILTMIDPASQTVSGTVAVGKQPHWTATSTDGKVALETNEGSNDVSVIDLSTMTLKSTIQVGEAPRKIVLLPGTIASSSTTSASSPAAAQPPAAGGAAASEAASAQPGAIEIRVERFSFGPLRAIGVGQTVAWVNADSVTHTVTADDDSWDSGDLEPGRTFSNTFDTAGEYAYSCGIHPHMRGQVTVR